MNQQQQQVEELVERLVNALDKLAGAQDKLANGQSHVVSPTVGRPFSQTQLAIETDFRALLTGLGRKSTKRLEFMKNPVLSKGKLELGKPLGADVFTIVSSSGIDDGWWFEVGDANSSNGGRILEHWAIESHPLPRRLVALNAARRPVLIGYPRT